MDTFDVFIERILGSEGGYVNNPKDPGGETKWGISKRTYPNLDIRNLSRVEAIHIYRRDFWEKSHAQDLPKALAFQILDMAVNSGTHAAIVMLQNVVKTSPDGYWGPKTRAAIEAADKNDLVLLYVAARIEFMANSPVWFVFSKGWMRRIAANLRYAAVDN
jgi:lysozyme family protein